MDQLSNDCSEMKAKLECVTNEKDELFKLLQEKQANYEAEMEKKQQRIDQLQNDLSVSSQIKSAVKVQNDSLKDDVKRSEAEYLFVCEMLEAEKARVSGLEKQYEKQRLEMETLRSNMSRISHQNGVKIKELEAEVRRSKERIQEQETEMTRLKDRHKGRQQRIDEYCQEIRGLEDERKKLKSDLKSAQTSRKRQKTDADIEIQKLTDELRNYKASNQRLGDRISSLKDEASQKDKKILELEKRLDVLETKNYYYKLGHENMERLISPGDRNPTVKIPPITEPNIH